MMTFLALAAMAGWPVASYVDHAVAHLGKNPRGQISVTRIGSVATFLASRYRNAIALRFDWHRAR